MLNKKLNIYYQLNLTNILRRIKASQIKKSKLAFKLTSMNIVITGASKGIGYEMVKQFASSNSNKIYAISRNQFNLDELVCQCINVEPNCQIRAMAFDISKQESLTQIYNQISSEVKSIDILINNAGHLVNKPFELTDFKDIEVTFKVNVFAPMLLIKQLLPLLKRAKNAHVVNITSMGGFQGSVKFTGLSAYSSSKSAIAGLTECLAEEYKESSIRFNALALGAVATQMLADAFPGYQAPLSASDMASYIVHFAQTGHQFFNGKIIPVSCTTP